VQACGRSESTLRSYGMDLLRWFRFCWSADLEWGQVTRAEAADFCRWLMIAGRPRTDGGYAPGDRGALRDSAAASLRFPS
jgi:hypothetical protein